jgi:acetyl-CoA carboxylase carboxyl transferase alpha subunit
VSAKSVGGRFVRRIAEKIHVPGVEETSESWEAIQLARHQDRPYPLDYIHRLCSEFEEIRGDRAYGDDPAIVAGVGRYNDEPVAFIGEQKGRDTQERTYRNFGMPSPEGYRKAMRLMELATKLDIPLVTLIDTPGAFPGAGAEQRGQGGAIARSIAAMVRIPVPTVAVIVGEGSSGGALAIGVADRVLIMANGTYSVISPEGGAAILWRDAGKARLAASAFKPTAATCYRHGIVDAVVPEPKGGAHKDHDEAARLLDQYLQRQFRDLRGIPQAERLRQRRERFRRLGVHREFAIGDPAAVAAGRVDSAGGSQPSPPQLSADTNGDGPPR